MAVDIDGDGAISGITSINDNVSSDELSSLDGVTSSLQSQIDSVGSLDSPTFTGNVTLPSTTSIGSVTDTEISHLSGLSSGAQGQIDAKADTTDELILAGSSPKLKFTSDGRIIEYLGSGFTSGLRISLGSIPWSSLSGKYVHVRMNFGRYNYWMVGFSLYGYGYNSTCIESHMTVYMYGPSGSPYQPTYVNLGNSGGFTSCYYADGGTTNLVLVIDKNSSSYTGGHLYYWTAAPGHGGSNSNDSVAILAMAGSGSTSGVY